MAQNRFSTYGSLIYNLDRYTIVVHFYGNNRLNKNNIHFYCFFSYVLTQFIEEFLAFFCSLLLLNNNHNKRSNSCEWMESEAADSTICLT